MNAGGRSVITMSAPKSKANDPRAANKRLTADAVKLIWRSTGRDLEKAEASGQRGVVYRTGREQRSRRTQDN